MIDVSVFTGTLHTLYCMHIVPLSVRVVSHVKQTRQLHIVFVKYSFYNMLQRPTRLQVHMIILYYWYIYYILLYTHCLKYLSL